LTYHKKTTQRQLTATQVAVAEKLKLTVLSKIEPFSEVSDEVVAKITSDGKGLSKTFGTLYDQLYLKVKEQQHREPTVDEARLIQATTYAALNV